MADTYTTHYNFDKCQVGADSNTWGGLLNANWDLLDTLLFTTFATFPLLTGATFTGTITTGDVVPPANTVQKVGSSSAPYSDAFFKNINFTSTGTTPALNCTFFSSGTGLALRVANASGQSFQIQNSTGVTQHLFDSSGNLTINGTGVAQNWQALSDARLKTDVAVIDGAMDKVNQLRGVRFTWKKTGVTSAGVIAQELLKVLPEGVSTGMDMLAVSPMAVVALLVEAVKTLNKRIEKLESHA